MPVTGQRHVAQRAEFLERCPLLLPRIRHTEVTKTIDTNFDDYKMVDTAHNI